MKDMQHMDATNQLTQKFHPDRKGQDPEDIEDEEAKLRAEYNVEGYKYRDFRESIKAQ